MPSFLSGGTVGAWGPLLPFKFNDPPLQISAEPQVFAADTGSGQFTLQDNAGGLWNISVLDTGALQTTSVSAGVPIVVVLDDPALATSWLLGVTTSGLLLTTGVNLGTTYPTVRWMGSTSTTWGLRVLANGLLQTQPSPTIFEDSCIGPMTIVNYGNSYGNVW